MSVLIDTSIWSLGLRRKYRDLGAMELTFYYEWESLLKRGEADIIGPIRQEVLSGIASARDFSLVKSRLALVPDLALLTDTYIMAAEFFNTCRSQGIAPGVVDMTICAAAHAYHVAIFTADPDFSRYAKLLPIALHAVPSRSSK